jgi:hypothetical protein
MSNARALSKIGRVVFHAYGNGTQAWSGGSSTTQVVQLNQQATLSGKVSGFNTSTYQFTAPVAGLYMFVGKITQTTASAGPNAGLYKNGTFYQEFAIGYSTAYMSSSGIVVIPLAAGDVVDMRSTNFNNLAVTLDTVRCTLTGILIG